MDAESMLFVHEPPVWSGIEPLFPEDFQRPEFEFGNPVKWKDDFSPRPVFIGETKLPEGASIYLFGLRYDTRQRADLAPGETEPNGFFVNYVVIETAGGHRSAVHVLAQWKSSTFQSGQERADSVQANTLKKKERQELCLAKDLPKWKEASARWPLVQGTPMYFVGQFSLPENDVTRRWLTFNTGVFLFWRGHEGVPVFKITTQDIKFQSAEDHYRAEARRMAKEQEK